MFTFNKKKKEFEFSGIGMILSLIFLFISFLLLHAYWLGEPFQSFLSILVTFYLLVCTWAFPYIIKEVIPSDHDMERLGQTILRGMYVVFYVVAPVIYLYLKFFDTKDRLNKEEKKEKNEENNQSKKLKFSQRGFIIGIFLFFVTFTISHSGWIGPPLQSLLSIIVTVCLGICTWALSYTLNDLDYIIDNVLEKPLGHVLLIAVHPVLYFISPLVFIRLKFFDKNKKQ